MNCTRPFVLWLTALNVGGVGGASAEDVTLEFASNILQCAALYDADEFAKYPTGVPEGRAQIMSEAFNAVIPYDTIETENAFLDRYFIARGEYMELVYDNEGLAEDMPTSLAQTIAMCDKTYTEVLARGLE